MIDMHSHTQTHFMLQSSTGESIVETFILMFFPTLHKGEYHGKDGAQVAIGCRVGQVVLQLECSLYYHLKSIHCPSRSDTELGEHPLSSPASSVWLPYFRSSQCCFGQMSGATTKLGEGRDSCALRFANCLYCSKASHTLKLSRIIFRSPVLERIVFSAFTMYLPLCMYVPANCLCSDVCLQLLSVCVSVFTNTITQCELASYIICIVCLCVNAACVCVLHVCCVCVCVCVCARAGICTHMCDSDSTTLLLHH